MSASTPKAMTSVRALTAAETATKPANAAKRVDPSGWPYEDSESCSDPDFILTTSRTASSKAFPGDTTSETFEVSDSSVDANRSVRKRRGKGAKQMVSEKREDAAANGKATTGAKSPSAVALPDTSVTKQSSMSAQCKSSAKLCPSNKPRCCNII